MTHRVRAHLSALVSRKSVIAALAITALAPAGAQAATDSIEADATFTRGALTVTAPDSSVDFGSTQLDGRASYSLDGDIGNWNVTDATGDLAGWTASVAASFPKASDTQEESTAAVMAMKVPAADGVGAAPAVASGDAQGLVTLTGSGSQVVAAAAEQGVGAWDLLQAGAGDLTLVMPYDTRPVQYKSTITYTVAQSL